MSILSACYLVAAFSLFAALALYDFALGRPGLIWRLCLHAFTSMFWWVWLAARIAEIRRNSI